MTSVHSQIPSTGGYGTAQTSSPTTIAQLAAELHPKLSSVPTVGAAGSGVEGWRVSHPRCGLGDLLQSSRRAREDVRSGMPVFLDGTRLVVGDLDETLAYAPAVLSRLGYELLEPVSIDGLLSLDVSALTARVVEPGSASYDVAQRLVLHEYGTRYLTAGLEAFEHLDASRRSSTVPRRGRTVVVESLQNGRRLVMGTMRVDLGPKLGLLDFFAPTGTVTAIIDESTRETGRVAFHPVLSVPCPMLDGASADARALYRVLILRQLYETCSDITGNFDDGGASPPPSSPPGVAYAIQAPHVARFCRRAGMVLTEAPGFTVSDTATGRAAREAFSAYWQPNSTAARPQVYVTDPALADVALPVGAWKVSVSSKHGLSVFRSRVASGPLPIPMHSGTSECAA